MKLNTDTLLRSYQQCVSKAVYLADNRKVGIRAHKALNKAMCVIEDRMSLVRLEQETLYFISKTGKPRIVTKSGCHETCDCKGLMSYHYALWLILDRYFKLEQAEKDGAADIAAQTKMVADLHNDLEKSWERHDRFQDEKSARMVADRREFYADDEWRMGL